MLFNFLNLKSIFFEIKFKDIGIFKILLEHVKIFEKYNN